MIYTHDVRISLTDDAGKVGWLPFVSDYELSSDMMVAADAFELVLPLTREFWRLSRPDNEINVYIDDTRVYQGRLDSRVRTLNKQNGSQITIRGRDKMGRVLDESAPLFSFGGMGIVELARKLAGEWFAITTSNAQNRRLLVGPRKKGLSTEPAIEAAKGKDAKKKVEPGESRWQVLQYFLEESGLLAWSTGDGSQLVLGRPNYTQAPQWRLFAAAPGSGRRLEHNIVDLTYEESIAERYSHVVVFGASASSGRDIFSSGTGSNPFAAGQGRKKKPKFERGEAKENPATADGSGISFRTRKRLYVFDNGVKPGNGKARAEREMAERDSTGRRLNVSVAGHGQSAKAGERPALFAFDTVAQYEDEETGVRGDWYITSLTFSGRKDSGQSTTLQLVPVGTDLRSVG